MSAQPSAGDLAVGLSIAAGVNDRAGCTCFMPAAWATWCEMTTTVDGQHRLLAASLTAPDGTLTERVLAAAVVHDDDCPALALVGQPQVRTVDPEAPAIVVVALAQGCYLDLSGGSFETGAER